MYKEVVFLVSILILASCWLYTLFLFSGPDDRLQFPRDVESLHKLADVFHEYSKENIAFTIVFFSSAYLYKQAFAIPGSIFLNLLSGALFGVWRGFLLCCLLSAVGSSLCFILSKFFTYKILLRYFPKRVQYFNELVEKNRESLFYFMLSLRIFPMSPNWLINMSAPICGCPLRLFFFSVLIGLSPYNLLTVQAGSMLSDLKSIEEIMSLKVILGLGALALAMLGPIFLKKRKVK